MYGSPLQLPPVGDAALYKRTTTTAHGFNLYRKFTDVVFFDRIQRQEGEDQREFREQLERLGKGQFTEEDWNKWQDRNLDLLPSEEREAFINGGLMACARRDDMHSHNVARVKAIGNPIAPITADSSPPAARGPINDKDASLPHKIILCEGAKVRLTDNLWVDAGRPFTNDISREGRGGCPNSDGSKGGCDFWFYKLFQNADKGGGGRKSRKFS